MSTAIQWTDETWNPLVAYDRQTGKRGWFCVHASTGCVNCYAEKMNQWRGNGHGFRMPELGAVEIKIDEATLRRPLEWRKPKKIFPCDMTDLFFEAHAFDQIARIFAVMGLAEHHTFQVLTKRSERAKSLLTDGGFWELVERQASVIRFGEPGFFRLPRPLPNVWLGTSVENQRAANERIPHLTDTPAAVRFLSCEPLLGPIDFYEAGSRGGDDGDPFAFSALAGADGCDPEIPGIDWVIIGGESGRNARPFNLEWCRDILAQCEFAGTVAFVKQLGALPVESESAAAALPYGQMLQSGRAFYRVPTGMVGLKLKDSHGGDPNEWPAELRVRQFPPFVDAPETANG